MVTVIVKLKGRPDKKDEIIAMNNAVKLLCKVMPEETWIEAVPHGLQGEITQENLELILVTPAITEVMNIEQISVSSTTA